MNAIDLGNVLLGSALLSATIAVLLALAAARFSSTRLLNAAKAALALVALLLTVSATVLAVLLVGSDFSVEYVAHYTERALPLGYKIAAFWAGQEGSLLLWAWLLSVMSVLAVLTGTDSTRRVSRRDRHLPGDGASPTESHVRDQVGCHGQAYSLARGDELTPKSTGKRVRLPMAPAKPTTPDQRPSSDQKRFRQNAIAAAVLSAVVGFFVALVFCVASPFQAGPVVADGQGLNPMLQNISMIAHPPVLFLGYAASTVPFAFMIGALVAGRTDAWLNDIRRWSLAAWLFLGVGILLGAQWAYVELGWGGYWAWDPVENASLLPWLTATGLLHSIISQQRRGMFRGWTAGLVASTFVLCIFGTYLTRSGVVQSVHAFRASQIGTFFLVFLCLAVVGTAAVIAARWKTLRPSVRIEGWLNRESAILAANVLLVAMTLITLFGTVFPLISGTLASEPVSVSAGFYNKAVLPLCLCLVLVMATGPALDAGKQAGPALRRLRWPVAAALVASVVAALVWHSASPWLIVAAAVCSTAVTCFLLELVKAWRARLHTLGENPLIALLRLLDTNHRRYGGQIVHMGIALIVAGVAGSSLLSVKQDLQLILGQTVAFAGGSLTFDQINQVARDNYQAIEATVTFTDAGGRKTILRPQRRFYTRSDESSSEVAIRSNFSRDLYVTLAGWEAGGDVVSFRAFVNPLVSWIWIGGLVMLLGAVICLLPKLEPAKRSVGKTAPKPSTRAEVGQGLLAGVG